VLRIGSNPISRTRHLRFAQTEVDKKAVDRWANIGVCRLIRMRVAGPNLRAVVMCDGAVSLLKTTGREEQRGDTPSDLQSLARRKKKTDEKQIFLDF